jgi:predicted DNA-binding protein with PD1-like motif
VAGRPVALEFRLEPGDPVDEALAKGFAAAGCAGGFAWIRRGRCDPFRFVMPADSPDDSHVAWYSATYAPEGPVEIVRAGAIVGERDGRPFIHCHGIWDTPDGRQMGHLLGPDTRVAEPIEVTGIGLRNATFQGLPDAETNFTLFEPVAVGESRDLASGPRALLAKVRPNEDISVAIEAICAGNGIAAAKVHGIGSLNEVHFVDGTYVASHATEVLIRDGRVGTEDGRPRARLDIDVVDLHGRVFSGELVRGDNPACITFELVIESLG